MKKSILLSSMFSILLLATAACGDSNKKSANSTSPSPINTVDVNTLFADKPLILEAVNSVVYPDLAQSDEGQLADFCRGMSTINSAVDLHLSNNSFLTQGQYDYLKVIYDTKQVSYQRSCF